MSKINSTAYENVYDCILDETNSGQYGGKKVFMFCWFFNQFCHFNETRCHFVLFNRPTSMEVNLLFYQNFREYNWNELDNNDAYSNVALEHLSIFSILFSLFLFFSLVIYCKWLNFNHFDFLTCGKNGMNTKHGRCAIKMVYVIHWISSNVTKKKTEMMKLKMRRAIVTAWVVIVTTGE